MKGYLFISNGVKPGLIIDKETYVDIESFSYSAIDAVHRMGYKIYRGYNVSNPELLHCNQYDITYYDQHTYRNIFAFRDNYKAYKNLCGFLRKHSDIEVIHCNTPIGGILGRICGHKFHKKVIYTAHGFHFYKGASLLNWLIYYPIEKFLAKWTDVIITINKEDYLEACKFMSMKGKVYLVPGVGVDISKYSQATEDRNELRKFYGIENNEIVFVSMGDLVKRKNYVISLRAIAESKVENLKYLICGDGPMLSELKQLCMELGIEKKVKFLGRRSDIYKIVKASDIFLFTSQQEGLARSLMEAMASGLPCLVSEIRGNTDLLDDGIGGYMYKANDITGFAEGIKELTANKLLRRQMGEENLKKVKNFDIDASKAAFCEIFKRELI